MSNRENYIIQENSEETTGSDHRMRIFYRRISKGHTIWYVSSIVGLLLKHEHDLARRAVVNLVSDADAMIKKFEDTFRDMKIELILGSSLQTAVVSFRVLQKVENIGR